MNFKPWYDKSNEKHLGIPLSRVPEWFYRGQWWSKNEGYTTACRLEELLIAYDKLVEDFGKGTLYYGGARQAGKSEIAKLMADRQKEGKE